MGTVSTRATKKRLRMSASIAVAIAGSLMSCAIPRDPCGPSHPCSGHPVRAGLSMLDPCVQFSRLATWLVPSMPRPVLGSSPLLFELGSRLQQALRRHRLTAGKAAVSEQAAHHLLTQVTLVKGDGDRLGDVAWRRPASPQAARSAAVRWSARRWQS